MVESYLGTNRGKIHSSRTLLSFRQHFYLKDLQVVKDSLSTFDFLDHEEELTESFCMYPEVGFSNNRHEMTDWDSS